MSLSPSALRTAVVLSDFSMSCQSLVFGSRKKPNAGKRINRGVPRHTSKGRLLCKIGAQRVSRSGLQRSGASEDSRRTRIRLRVENNAQMVTSASTTLKTKIFRRGFHHAGGV